MSDFREFQDGEVVPGTRYRVACLIGTGGMGRVYEVEHIELGKRFVLKALQRELSRREDLVARLRNEWRALARLEHPNIVNVTDAGTSDNGVPFYVMERLEGETLSLLLHRNRRLHPQHALTIASAILEGLHAAHQIGVVHRDVKPPNIFLTGSGTVKVLDFGIAKIKDAKGVITARGIAVGTPRYMSPEQAQGTAVDARSDIYATGLMLFEMLSGVGPFDDARDNNELLLAQLGRKAPLLSSISVVAPELDAVVAGMLAKDPRERPPSARDVAETLRALGLRYAHFVATEAPTVNATPRPAPPSEPPTRVEGQRRASQPAPAATRPDGVAAQGRASGAGDTTTLQPALELQTTAAHTLPNPNITQRLPDASPVPFFGSDTLVDPLTRAPTAVPGAAPERTEMLLTAARQPGASPVPDAGPTRTAMPLAEAPNLTPPPVVPSGSLPSPKLARPRRWWGVSAFGLGLAVVLGAVVAARFVGRASDSLLTSSAPNGDFGASTQRAVAAALVPSAGAPLAPAEAVPAASPSAVSPAAAPSASTADPAAVAPAASAAALSVRNLAAKSLEAVGPQPPDAPGSKPAGAAAAPLQGRDAAPPGRGAVPLEGRGAPAAMPGSGL